MMTTYAHEALIDENPGENHMAEEAGVDVHPLLPRDLVQILVEIHLLHRVAHPLPLEWID